MREGARLLRVPALALGGGAAEPCHEAGLSRAAESAAGASSAAEADEAELRVGRERERARDHGRKADDIEEQL